MTNARIGGTGLGAWPWVLALCSGLVSIAGCSVMDDGAEAVPGWVEPGWMAQVRQQDEEFQTAMVSCYAEYGIEGTRSMAGGVLLVNLGGDTGPIPPEVQEVVDAMADDCNARIPIPKRFIDKTFDEATYGRMLDTRACMIAHGYDVPEAPSFETWKDSGLERAWNPYTAVFGGSSGASISNDDMMVLDAACPQGGPNFAVIWSAPDE